MQKYALKNDGKTCEFMFDTEGDRNENDGSYETETIYFKVRTRRRGRGLGQRRFGKSL